MQAHAQTQLSDMRQAMLDGLAENWWLVLLRGIAAILFGVLAFVWPGITLATLVLLYGAFALVDGITAVAAAIRGSEAGSRWWLAMVGMAGIVAGLLTFIWPGLSAFVLLVLIATWAVVVGIFEIIGAIRMRKEIDNEWLLILSGVVSVLFGIVLLAQPAAGAIALVFVIGGFAVVYGTILVSFAFRLRQRLIVTPK